MTNTATVKKINVHYIIDGVHTDECEAFGGWDEWNTDLKDEIKDGRYQCRMCKSVWVGQGYVSLQDFNDYHRISYPDRTGYYDTDR